MNAFTGALLAWYDRSGRSNLPWRATRDPYAILVSEFMLQQTQVDRVIPKYREFLERFPDFPALAAAPASDVLRIWKGLGYNSRAIRLKKIATQVCERYGGVLPRDPAALRELPGIGAYTAAAVRAFAFDAAEVASDTNVRRVVHRYLAGVEFPPKRSARELDAGARELLGDAGAHDWNSAVMDLGAAVCTARAPKCAICPLAHTCAAAPVDASELELARRAAVRRSPQEQLPFVQTRRFARGRIVDRLRDLPPGAGISLLDLRSDLGEVLPPHSLGAVETLVADLERDGIISRRGEIVALSE